MVIIIGKLENNITVILPSHFCPYFFKNKMYIMYIERAVCGSLNFVRLPSSSHSSTVAFFNCASLGSIHCVVPVLWLETEATIIHYKITSKLNTSKYLKMQNDTLHLQGNLKYWVVTTFLSVNAHLVNTRVLFKCFTFLFSLVLMLQVRIKFRFK